MAAGVDMDRGALLRWGETAWRDLPWRRSRDPWGVLVSELMLQQTQVERVRERWPRFLADHPDPAACAAAGQAAIVRAWSGLGYNRRAAYLHRSAAVMVAEHGGRVPDRLDQLLALPGVGPYTARAVLAFAYGCDVGVLDTNVGRVLARLGGESLRPRQAQALADELVPEGEGWRWNQVLLDLGATVCTARAPSCAVCPLAESCAWRGRGPDPALGSAGVSGPQGRFADSDRQGRGRLIAALRSAPVHPDALAEVMGWSDGERAERVASSLVADGLVRRVGARYELA